MQYQKINVQLHFNIAVQQPFKFSDMLHLKTAKIS